MNYDDASTSQYFDCLHKITRSDYCEVCGCRRKLIGKVNKEDVTGALEDISGYWVFDKITRCRGHRWVRTT